MIEQFKIINIISRTAKKELGKVYLRENLIERVFCGLRNWEEITKKVGGE